ncbi:hypothetical protein CSB08_00380 [Candidatus Gracilibacteria bacterium]|nr:MAG: hypothetical protein CSB08_00380 [Candidatus Gracilibacteria bacterium]PIE85299.1 MAG: hypothetical protein CSA08_02730 [Candidatus Gracilibacteria bacterium]
MLGKEKEKNLYSMLLAVGGMFTFVTVIIVYGMIDYKLKSIDKLSSDVEKLLNIQFSQIGGEENYSTILEIGELSKDQATSQMKQYLEQLRAQKSGKAPSNNNEGSVSNEAPEQMPESPVGKVSVEEIKSIKDSSYIDGNVDAKITWIEYSDLECPYCARLHNSGTPEALKEKYGEKLNIIFNHFPLEFHANAFPGAQVLECTGELGGSENFYEVMKASFKSKNSSKDFLVDTAVGLGVDKDALNECIASGKHDDKIKSQVLVGSQKFGVTGTPGNVLVNNETGEFRVLSGALPTSEFEKAIDELLK